MSPEEAQSLVTKLRQEKYLVDPVTGVAARNTLTDDLRRALKKLAGELYAKDVHFVFELLQNAEDNRYPDGVSPSIVFRLLAQDPTETPGAQGALVVDNNEVGFSGQDFLDICSIGDSHKAPQKGFIGEKGIGFKSVFKVSDAPHIFSNGLSFSLPRSDETTGLGYIVPRPCPPLPDGSHGTTLILPLLPGKFAEIANRLRDLAPQTILFLHKIRSVRICVDGQDELSFVRDATGNIVNLTRTEGGKQRVEIYWVTQRKFGVPSEIQEETRKEVLERIVTIALPLSGETVGGVFAYLPTEVDSSLPFLVNADFLLTSSRESILTDSEWNQWLRDCLSEAFVAAFDGIVRHKEHGPDAYKFIPIVKEVRNDFFQPVADSIRDALSKHECVLVDGSHLAKPSECVLASDRARKVFGQSNPPSPLKQRPLVITGLRKYERQLEQIGVKAFGTDDVLACLNDRTWLQARDKDWFVSCFQYLTSYQWKDDYLRRLRACPIVPIEGGLSCTAEQAIYFEAGRGELGSVGHLPPSVAPHVGALRSELWAAVKEDEDVVKLLRDVLWVREFGLQEYATDVLRRIVDGQNLSDADVVRGTQWLAANKGLTGPHEDLPIVLAGGMRATLAGRSANGKCVVVPAATEELGWQLVFRSADDREHLSVLSDHYLYDDSGNRLSDEVLGNLLGGLPAARAPMPAHVELHESLNTMTQYETGIMYKRRSTRLREITNYRPVSWLLKLLNGQVVDDVELLGKALLIWLERIIPEDFDTSKSRPAFAEARVEFFFRTGYYAREESEFLHVLKRTAWLPTSKGPKIPNECFLRTGVAAEMLGDAFPLVDEMPTRIATLLGVYLEPTEDVLVGILEKASAEGGENSSAYARIYEVLAGRGERLSPIARNRFRAMRLIYLPSGKKWFSTKEVVWLDRTEVLGAAFGYVQKAYPALQSFFVGVLGVRADVGPENYAHKWLELSGGGSGDARTILSQVYRALGSCCKEMNGGGQRPDWWYGFGAAAKVFCRDGKFRDRSMAFVSDDQDLARKFSSDAVFQLLYGFVWRPDPEPSDTKEIFRALGIEYLSECLESSPAADNLTRREMPEYVTDGTKALIIGELWSEDRYSGVCDPRLLSSILGIVEFTADTLNVTFTLKSCSVTETRDAYWDRAGSRLIIASTCRDERQRKRAIADTIARSAVPNRAFKNLRDVIHASLGESVQEAKKDLQDRERTLPEEAKSLLSGTERKAQTQSPIECGKVQEQPVTSEQSRHGELSSPDTHEEPAPDEPDVEAVEVQSGSPSTIGREALDEALHRPGATATADLPEDDAVIGDSGRRQERLHEETWSARMGEPGAHERWRQVTIERFEPKDPRVRQSLLQYYAGRCQVCNSTFPKRNSQPYFEVYRVVSRIEARWVDTAENALCLCPTCGAKFMHADRDLRPIAPALLDYGAANSTGTAGLGVKVRLAGEEREITFKPRHALDWHVFLKHVFGQGEGARVAVEDSQQTVPPEPEPKTTTEPTVGELLDSGLALLQRKKDTKVPDRVLLESMPEKERGIAAQALAAARFYRFCESSRLDLDNAKRVYGANQKGATCAN